MRPHADRPTRPVRLVAGGALVAILLLGGPPDAARAQEGADDRLEELEERLEAQERETERLRRELETVREGDGASSPDGAGDDELGSLLDSIEEEEVPEEHEPAEETFAQQALNVLNPRITVFGDFLFQAGLNESQNQHPQDDRFKLREVEIDLRAAIDPYADGVMIVAYESEEPGELGGEVLVEEGYARLNFVPGGFVPTIGRFRPTFGRMNRLHVHDLPQFSYPVPVQAWLGEEGFAENGVRLEWNAPPLGETSFRFTGEVINSENEESPVLHFDPTGTVDLSRQLAYIGQASVFRDLSEDLTIELGASALLSYPTDSSEAKARAYAGNAMLKWRPGRSTYRSLVLQGGLYYADFGDVTGEYPVGGHAFLQAQLDQNWYVGTRWGYAETLGDADDRIWRTGAYVSYYFTEFLRGRVGYEHTEFIDFPGPTGHPHHDAVLFQLTFVFGSHPSHPYWVNR